MAEHPCILFDLDGTLVSTGGAGNRALDAAFVKLYGIRHAMKDVDPAGKTDPAIIREIFRAQFGRDCSPDEMRTVQQTYLDQLPLECEKAHDYRVMDGIPGLLNSLTQRRAVMGLGTGNIEKGARIKLLRGKLNEYLPFGGFGSDSEDRPTLLTHALAKAEKHTGQKFSRGHVFVVGDTERDIHAAKKAGLKVIAVATGRASVDELEAHDPDYCINDFTDNERFLNIIYNGNGRGKSNDS